MKRRLKIPIIAIISLTVIVALFFAVKPISLLFHHKFEGYVAFKEMENVNYNDRVLVIQDISKADILDKSERKLEQLAQQEGDECATRGKFFSMNKKDFNKLEKGQRIIVYFKSQALPDIWGYPARASKIKIINE